LHYCLFALFLLQVREHQESLLAFLGETTGGSGVGFNFVDARVLVGAVLTSFVGVSGLLNRTLDRILPNYF
jgi:hypothetical protein